MACMADSDNMGEMAHCDAVNAVNVLCSACIYYVSDEEYRHLVAEVVAEVFEIDDDIPF